ncbi:MAG: hypothetical protein QG552_2049 [Thermodesulfobacteriota bacterium]|nr:hypothetical protein [Thermodesulfobacteriota bacterium]
MGIDNIAEIDNLSTSEKIYWLRIFGTEWLRSLKSRY